MSFLELWYYGIKEISITAVLDAVTVSSLAVLASKEATDNEDSLLQLFFSSRGLFTNQFAMGPICLKKNALVNYKL